ncbi:hypothetical protein Vadar_004703 [Vaccinium darrowii]|uniref:Uncharacterized protein n=1 Tax=Vaccinium darrowii TaxID=229202 RepID=A0ACB7YBP7_9ERIC|nr:hypothetical protein Vadar_004703 [Vaccinium darrowii]
MAVLPRKRLVLVAFFLLCFVSIIAKARSVPKETGNGGDDPKAEGGLPESTNSDDQDLVTVDYTPAQKRPPIHN